MITPRATRCQIVRESDENEETVLSRPPKPLPPPSSAGSCGCQRWRKVSRTVPRCAAANTLWRVAATRVAAEVTAEPTAELTADGGNTYICGADFAAAAAMVVVAVVERCHILLWTGSEAVGVATGDRP